MWRPFGAHPPGAVSLARATSGYQERCYHTSKSGDEQISLQEYVDRMKEGQNDIYYITGESIAAVSSSPFLETLRKKGIEVLYMIDPIDEDSVQQLKETATLPIVSVLRSASGHLWFRVGLLRITSSSLREEQDFGPQHVLVH